MKHSPPLPRRGLLAGLAALPVLALAGCGFQLRRAPDFAFRSIAVPGNSLLANLLRRNLKAQGNLQVVPDAEVQTAEVICDILGEERSRGIAASTSAGQVREITLNLQVRFRLRMADGREMIPATALTQSRDISFNESAALAKENEEALLYRDMTADIAQQILRHLGAAKPV